MSRFSACCVAVRPDMLFMIGGIFAASMLFRLARAEAGISLGCSAVVFAAERLGTSYAAWWHTSKLPLYGSHRRNVGGAALLLTRIHPGLALAARQDRRRRNVTLRHYSVAGVLLRPLETGRIRQPVITIWCFYGVLSACLDGRTASRLRKPAFSCQPYSSCQLLACIWLRLDFSGGVAFAISRRFSGGFQRSRDASGSSGSERPILITCCDDPLKTGAEL